MRRQGNPKVCHVNHAAFDVRTPETEYWAGFLLADGCIVSHYNRQTIIELGLALKDEGHVQKFRAFVGSDHTIGYQRRGGMVGGYRSTGMARLAFPSNYIASVLATYGVVPRKSTRAVPIGLTGSRDFWRGMVDGDGTVGIMAGDRYGGEPYFALTGSLSVVSAFGEYIHTKVPRFRANPVPQRNIWHISGTHRIADEVIHDLYANATVSLDRKQAIADRIMGVAA
jgi:hypothetical protein